MAIHIRNATIDDLPRIVEIYNESIPGGWSTADTSPITVADRVEWFRKFDATKRPIWVAECGQLVVGTTYLSSFYGGRPAYNATAEISVYVSTAFQKRGIGTMLKEWVIARCPELGITTLLSMYFDHNQATRKINEKLGFRPMGHLTDIAIVDGVSRGLVISGLRIPSAGSSHLPDIG
jgi:phosphinothricin acetyltransferase